LPRGPHDSRTFDTATGKARFTVNEPDAITVPEGHLLLQTVRSHDQFNTTIYGLDDRYRGIHGGRRVVFVNAEDLAARGLADGDMVDLVSVWSDGERYAKGFGRWPMRLHGDVWPRTFLRPTCWYPLIRPPSAATHRRRNR